MNALHPSLSLARLRSAMVSAALCVVAFGFIVAACLTGVEKKLDARINYGFLTDEWAMTIAISEGYYGLHHAYIGQPEVFNALNRFLPWDAPDAQALAQDRDAIEYALQAAISLNPKTFMHYHGYRPPFILNMDEDYGQADYYQLAFALFGFHATSMYYLFFLLFGFSAAIFVWQYRCRPRALAALVLLTFSFWTLFFLNTFSDPGMPSVNSNRFMEALGIIPTLHLLLLLRGRKEVFSRIDYVCVALQSLLLAFTLSVRSSTNWQWLLVVGWVLVPAAWLLWRHRVKYKQWFLFLWHEWRHTFALFAVFLGVTCGYNFIRMQMLAPVYFSECVLPNHYTWHSAYLGLTYHPKWPEVQPPEAVGKYGDSLGRAVAEKHFVPTHAGDKYICTVINTNRARSHEEALRRALFEFIWDHPRYSFELYFWYKPLELMNNTAASLKLLPGWWFIVIEAIVAAGLVLGLWGITAGLWGVTAIILLALGMSTLPSLFAYPSYLQNVVWLALTLAALVAFSLPAALGYAVHRLVLRISLKNT